MRTAATVVGFALVAAVFAVLTAPAASACSCPEPTPVGEAVADAEWVFVARQTGIEYEDTPDGRKARLQMEVITVYKGNVPENLELRTNAGGGDCGVDFTGLDAVGLAITPSGDGTAYVGSCAGVYLPDEIRWLYEPLPTGAEHGDLGFIVGTDVGPARIAVLDEQARLIGYGMGEGRLIDAAVCPGAKKVVEIVGPDDEEASGDAGPWLEVRDIATLEVNRRFEIDPPGDIPQLPADRVIDLQCHDPDGDFVTYLLPMPRWDSPAPLHVWRDGELAVVDMKGARAVAVDPDRELAYTIVGADGMTLEVRHLAGELVESMPVPLGHQAWKLAFTPDRSALVMLTTDDPMQSEHWFYAEVNSMLVMDLQTGEASVFPLPKTGNASLFAPRTDGYTAVTFDVESRSMMVTNLRDGEIEVVGEYPVVWYPNPVAVGSNTVLLADTEDWNAQAVLALDLSTGEPVSIVDLIRSSTAVSFPGPVPSAQPLPVVTTTVPSTTTTSGTSDSTETTRPAVTLAAEQEPADTGSTPWPALLVVVVVAGFLGLGIARTRRLRRPKP